MMDGAGPLDYGAYWDAALPWPDYLATVVKHAELWHAIDARARVDDALVRRVEAVPGPWRLLVLSEDWCGDAVNLVPPVAALAARARNVEVRVTGRDANPDLMNAHLWNGTRSIPVVILLDAAGRMRGWWGPRPAALQEWFVRELRALPSKTRYPLLRGWYARDRARTTYEELVSLIERAGAADLRRSVPA